MRVFSEKIMNFLNRKKSEPVEVLNKKGYEFNQLGEYEKAIECYDELLNVESNVVALKNKGYALIKLNKNEDAVECYNEVLDVEPNDLVALKNKGYALKQLGKHEDAMECIQRASHITKSKK